MFTVNQGAGEVLDRKVSFFALFLIVCSDPAAIDQCFYVLVMVKSLFDIIIPT